MSMLTDSVLELVLQVPSEALEDLTPEKQNLAYRNLNNYFNSRRMTETQFQTDIWCTTVAKKVDDLKPAIPWKYPTPKTVCQELAEVLTVTLAPLGVPFGTIWYQTLFTAEKKINQELLNLLYDPTVDNRPLFLTEKTARESREEVFKAESLLASLLQ